MQLLEWALNYRSDLISAGIASRFETGFRCPQCAERVTLRRGAIYKAHFAHVSGARKLDCELYFPGASGQVANGRERRAQEAFLQEDLAAEAANLVWDPGRDAPSALSVRIPSSPGVVITLLSRRGTSIVRPKEGSRPTYVRVGLASPPATCETDPYTPSIQELVVRALDSFRLSWNYFRANASGTATIVDPAAPLEEGEEYWLVTQTLPSRSPPQGVEIVSTKQERSWHIINLRVTAEPALDATLRQARSEYLNRAVRPARPKLELLWPRPVSVEPDGIRSLARSTRRLIVRSSHSTPICLADGSAFPMECKWLAGDLFEVSVPNECAGLKLMALGSRPQRICLSDSVYLPPGVLLRCEEGGLPLLDSVASKYALQHQPCQLELPYQRLLSVVHVSRVVTPERGPNRAPLTLGPDAIAVDCRNFGWLRLRETEDLKTVTTNWTSRLSPHMRRQIAPHAFRALMRVSSRAQLMSWANTYSYKRLLPAVTKILSLEPNSAIS